MNNEKHSPIDNIGETDRQYEEGLPDKPFDPEEMKKVQEDIDSVNRGAIIDKSKLLNQAGNNELSQLLFDCQQILTGYSQDESWSEWDESVRKRLTQMQYVYPYKNEGLPDKPLKDENEYYEAVLLRDKIVEFIETSGKKLLPSTKSEILAMICESSPPDSASKEQEGDGLPDFEFTEWASENNWKYFPGDKKWRKNWTVEKTTEQLYQLYKKKP